MAGEIELLPIRNLQYVIGHDAAGLAGRGTGTDHLGYCVGLWYTPHGAYGAAAGGAPGTGSIRIAPYYLKQKCTLAAMGVRINTLSAGGNVQAALYANDPTQAPMRPTGNALVSTASMSTTLATMVNATASIQLEAGLYWWATNCDNATAVMGSVVQSNNFMNETIGTATQVDAFNNGGSCLTGLSVVQAFGTWPDLTSASFTEVLGQTMPLVMFKVASVP